MLKDDSLFLSRVLLLNLLEVCKKCCVSSDDCRELASTLLFIRLVSSVNSVSTCLDVVSSFINLKEVVRDQRSQWSANLAIIIANPMNSSNSEPIVAGHTYRNSSIKTCSHILTRLLYVLLSRLSSTVNLFITVSSHIFSDSFLIERSPTHNPEPRVGDCPSMWRL